MKPTIPFEFDPDPLSYETDHLIYKDTEGGVTVSWPVAGIEIYVPKYEIFPNIESMEKENGILFKMHGQTGFSIGRYHEILVSELPTHMAFKMGDIEVSFGVPTPIAAFLFNSIYYEKYYGGWEYLVSARILGADSDEYEQAFINSAIHYHEIVGIVPTPYSMSINEYVNNQELYESFEEFEKYNNLLERRHASNNIDPLRFFYRGLATDDVESSCLYFYKVIEYYSFFIRSRDISKLRYDNKVSDHDFSRKITDLITREEKAPIIRLIVNLCDSQIMKKSLEFNIIDKEAPNTLAEKLYEFRNSIVHGKYSYGNYLKTSSVINGDNMVYKHKEILQILSSKAIRLYS